MGLNDTPFWIRNEKNYRFCFCLFYFKWWVSNNLSFWYKLKLNFFLWQFFLIIYRIWAIYTSESRENSIYQKSRTIVKKKNFWIYYNYSKILRIFFLGSNSLWIVSTTELFLFASSKNAKNFCYNFHTKNHVTLPTTYNDILRYFS